MKKNNQHNRGFTLMETIIYIALFGLLMTGAVIAAYNLLDSGARNEKAVSIQEEGTFLNRKINWALLGATAITAPDENTLSITRPDLGANSPVIIKENGTQITMQRGAGDTIILNSDAFPVTNMIFLIEHSGNATSITVTYKVENTPFIFKSYLR